MMRRFSPNFVKSCERRRSSDGAPAEQKLRSGFRQAGLAPPLPRQRHRAAAASSRDLDQQRIGQRQRLDRLRAPQCGVSSVVRSGLLAKKLCLTYACRFLPLQLRNCGASPACRRGVFGRLRRVCDGCVGRGHGGDAGCAPYVGVLRGRSCITMELAKLAERLERARRAVAEGDASIQHQRDLIARLKEAGGDTGEARLVLDALLKRQAERQQNLAMVIKQFPPG